MRKHILTTAAVAARAALFVSSRPRKPPRKPECSAGRLTGLLYLFADTTKFDSADHFEISGDTQRASKVYQSLRLPVDRMHSI